jgi:hypothetical protein
MTVIANCWGNIEFGFRELSQANGESTVEAFAWDLETNSKRTVTFTVPHKRFSGGKATPLVDPRDIYELVANNAQRRVRSCLEAVIPPDIVEDAVSQCRETLKQTAEVTPDSIQKTLQAFTPLGVTKEQIESRLGRRIESMQPAQLVNLRRIYKSLQEGMSKPADWFSHAVSGAVSLETLTGAEQAAVKLSEPEPQEPQADATEGVSGDVPPHDESEAGQEDGATDGAGELANWKLDVDAASTNGRLDQLAEEAAMTASPPIRQQVYDLITARRLAIAEKKGKKAAGK